MKKIDIVISYYNEDLSWIDKLNKNFVNNIFIYNKSGDERYIPLPNIGLDSHTHLYHIVNNYENLGERIIFLQGNPFGHECDPRSIDDINNWMIQLQEKDHTLNYLISPFDMGLYSGKIEYWNGNNLKDTGYTIRDWMFKFLNHPREVKSGPVYWSCQFGVTKELIHKKNLLLYQSLLDQHNSKYTEVTHFIERSWGVIFEISPDPEKMLINMDKMINFEFVSPTPELPEGMTKISLDGKSKNFFKESQFPLRIIHKKINGKIVWSQEIYPDWFSHYPENSYTAISIIDSLGNTIFNWKWDVNLHGDFCHQFFENWSNLNLGANGICIGTHDGTSGEWVGPVINGKLKATLVEASNLQYGLLSSLYEGYPWVNIKNHLVTGDGRECIFYSGGNGLTDSVNLDLIEKYVNPESINTSKRDSISINDLIGEVSSRGKVRWIHMDVEGIDGELIYSIEEDLLPEIIIFESLNMTKEYRDELYVYLINKNYNLSSSGYNTVAFKDIN